MPDWNTLLEEHGPLVLRISWRILGNRADVEDNLQDHGWHARACARMPRILFGEAPVVAIHDTSRRILAARQETRGARFQRAASVRPGAGEHEEIPESFFVSFELPRDSRPRIPGDSRVSVCAVGVNRHNRHNWRILTDPGDL